MVNMANRPDVAVRLVTLKLCFRHNLSLSSLTCGFRRPELISFPAWPENWSG
jgi:hypothetical protein